MTLNPSQSSDRRQAGGDINRRVVAFAAMAMCMWMSMSAVAGVIPIPNSVFPSGANLGGGGSVVISGTNIGTDIANTTVTIGGVAATIFANSNDDIDVTVPARATSGAVSVVVHKTSGAVLISDAFLYQHDYRGARDFSNTANPNGPWQYGWSIDRAAPFQLITDPVVRSSCIQGWVKSGGIPAVLRSRSEVLCSLSTWYWPEGRIGAHPAPDGSNAVIRFIAPETTNYHVSGDFTGIDPHPTTSDGAILQNGVELFSANVGYNAPQTFDLRLDLTAGDTLDFKVGTGGNGFSYDQTTLVIVITGDILLVDGLE